MQSALRLDNELELAPINPAWVREGEPEARVQHWGTSKDGSTNTFVWSCTAGSFDWTFDEDEIVHIVDGSVTVTSPEGETRTLEVGDSCFFPAGTTWFWTVPTYVRKHAVLVRPLPFGVRHGLRAARKARRVAADLSVRVRGGQGADATPAAMTNTMTGAPSDLSAAGPQPAPTVSTVASGRERTPERAAR